MDKNKLKTDINGIDDITIPRSILLDLIEQLYRESQHGSWGYYYDSCNECNCSESAAAAQARQDMAEEMLDRIERMVNVGG